MGSVKDIEIIRKPTRESMGIARFHFSDRYSVFDWGEMPDHIDGKGAALCLMGAYCFERLEEKGIKTHYRGLITKDGKKVGFDELEEPTNIMEFNLVNVIKPKPTVSEGKLIYDYSIFTSNLTNFLIPFEIIYRNGLPPGSSIFKRLKRGLIKPENLGLDHYPKPGEKLPRPFFDISTKLEEKDRYLTWEEAKKLANLRDEEIEEMKRILFEINNLITEIASKANLENEDGKVEFAFDPKRKLMVVDVVGTLDECRFTYKGIHVSKEIAREFYRKTNWYREVEKAKRMAEEKGVENWRRLCGSTPPPLDPQLRKIISQVYMAAANEFTGRKFFEVPKLVEVLKEYEIYLSKF